MPTNWDAVTIGLAVLVGLNCLVSLRVGLAKGFTAIQKILQITIIWVVPLLGAIGIWLFHRTDSEPKGPSEPPFGGGAHDGMPGGVQ